MSKDLMTMDEYNVADNTTFEQDITTIKDVTTKAFLITGKLLQNIHAGKKYKDAGYKTFKEAVECELDLKQSRAYQLMDAVVVYENFHNCGTFLPTKEAQVRPLTKLNPEQQLEIWQEVAKDKVPTAKEVSEAVKKLKGYSSVSPTKKSVKAEKLIDKEIDIHQIIMNNPDEYLDTFVEAIGKGKDTYGELRTKLEAAGRKIYALTKELQTCKEQNASNIELMLATDTENQKLKLKLNSLEFNEAGEVLNREALINNYKIEKKALLKKIREINE